MLRQNGGPMGQDEIADIFPGDLEYFAEIIKAMATKKLLSRKWDPALAHFSSRHAYDTSRIKKTATNKLYQSTRSTTDELVNIAHT
jgi:hypothetical protein